MEVKIIENKESAIDGLIVWDCFRGSYTKLMYTIPHLIECSIHADYNTNGLVEITLRFNMYDTTGFQEQTRTVRGQSIYSLSYTVKNISEEIIIDYFDMFFDDFIRHENEVV